MDEKFLNTINLLPVKLEQLKKTNAITAKDLSNVPKKGVYIFWEENKAIYVGRTDNMKRRLTEHGRKSSKHNDASFAFKIAKTKAALLGINTGTRKELEKNPQFSILFSEAKRQVSEMEIKFIEIEEPLDQALFEIYAATVLKTRYNDFKNH